MFEYFLYYLYLAFDSAEGWMSNLAFDSAEGWMSNLDPRFAALNWLIKCGGIMVWQNCVKFSGLLRVLVGSGKGVYYFRG